jgi:hypothetical protein
MGWGMLWLFVALKIPLLALCYLVWWAIKQEPEPIGGEETDGGEKTRLHPAPTLPRPPRRGPHGEASPPSPPRVRPLNARAKRTVAP